MASFLIFVLRKDNYNCKKVNDFESFIIFIQNHLNMKYLLFLACIFIIQSKIKANQATVPVEIVYKYLDDKYSSKSDSEIFQIIDVLVTNYLKSELNVQNLSPLNFYDNNLDILYLDNLNDVFSIDTNTVKELFNCGKGNYLGYDNDENNDLYGDEKYLHLKPNLTSLRYIDKINQLDYRYDNIPVDSILNGYLILKKEISKIKEVKSRIIWFAKLEVFISHFMHESGYTLKQRLNTLDNSINTKLSDENLAELYYALGCVLKDSNEEEIGDGYFYKSYQIGLKGNNIFSEKSHLELLKIYNRDYYDLGKSENSPYNHHFGGNYYYAYERNSNQDKSFNFLLEEQKMKFLQNIYFKKSPTNKLDIEYTLMLYNTIFNTEFRFPEICMSWSVTSYNYTTLNEYALIEIMILLEYAKSHDIELDPNIVSNSLTNLASIYWHHKNPDLHVYSTYAAFKAIKLNIKNYSQYTSLYKMFCDISDCYTPYSIRMSEQFINNGMNSFSPCFYKTGYNKMLSSEIIYNIKRSKLDVAKMLYDSLWRIRPYGESISDERDFILEKLDYNYYYVWGNKNPYTAIFTIMPNDSNLLVNNLTLENEFTYSESKAFDLTFKLLENIQNATSEVEQLHVKKDIEQKKLELFYLNKQLEDTSEALASISHDIRILNHINDSISSKNISLARETDSINILKGIALDSLNKVQVELTATAKAKKKFRGGAYGFGVGFIAACILYYFARKKLKKTNKEKLEIEKELDKASINFLKDRLNIHNSKGGLNDLSLAFGNIMSRLNTTETNTELKTEINNFFERIKMLRDYTRQCIENSKVSLIPLKEEIANSRLYLKMHNFQETTKKIDFKISDSLLAALDRIDFPANMLQPIIQNCLQHAFTNYTNVQGNKIELDLIENELVVRDNGRGNREDITDTIRLNNNTKISTDDIQKYLSGLNKQKVTQLSFNKEECVTHSENGTIVKFKNLKND